MRCSPKGIVKRTTGHKPGAIILMHCAREVTAEALPEIIDHYQARGIKLIGLDEMEKLTGAKRGGTLSRPTLLDSASTATGLAGSSRATSAARRDSKAF